MSKKKSSKKHNFKHSQSDRVAGSPTSSVLSRTVAQVEVSGTKPKLAHAVPAGLGDFTYVKRDLRKVAALGCGFVLFQLVLWFAFAHTSLGPTVYHLFTGL